MGTVSPTGKQIKELMNSADDKPVVMVNLLKFKKITESGEQGREAYDRYGRNTMPILKEIGARVLWLGSLKQVFIGGEHDYWDEVLLVEYPSRKAFLQMISRPDYLQIHKDRETSLEKTCGDVGAKGNKKSHKT
jgi:uncharacterized protein (DUF1330 family)